MSAKASNDTATVVYCMLDVVDPETALIPGDQALGDFGDCISVGLTRFVCFVGPAFFRGDPFADPCFHGTADAGALVVVPSPLVMKLCLLVGPAFAEVRRPTELPPVEELGDCHQGIPGAAPLFSLVSDSSAFFPVVDVLGKDAGWGEEDPVSGVVRVEAAAGAETL